MSSDSESTENLKAAIRKALNEFNALRLQRHRKGAEEYGEFTFLGNDVIRMMLEELADTTNYIEYQATKLLLLQKALEQDSRLTQLTTDGEIKIGIEAFRGTKEGWQ
jgi:hypothetical protein